MSRRRPDASRTLDRLERRGRFGPRVPLGLAVIAAIGLVVWLVRPSTRVGEVGATVREVRVSTLPNKYLRTSKVIEVQLDNGEIRTLAVPSHDAPGQGVRVLLTRVVNAFGHVDYHWEGHLAKR